MKLQNGEVTLKSIFPKRLWDKTQEMFMEGMEIDEKGQPKLTNMAEVMIKNAKVEGYKMLNMIESLMINQKNIEINDDIFDYISKPDSVKILKEIDKIAGIGQDLPLQ